MVLFQCKNCLWSGTPEEMVKVVGGYHCPECENSYCTDGETTAGWDMIIEDDPEDEDYGDFS